ncbi:MAG: YitT family protein [Spirosomaceae bacterium]|nr:YitT family protein [Spirosomataceae bacterium]
MSAKESLDWKEIFSFKSISFIILGAVCGVIAIKGFMIPNHLLDGGITGISILLHEIFHIEVFS